MYKPSSSKVAQEARAEFAPGFLLPMCRCSWRGIPILISVQMTLMSARAAGPSKDRRTSQIEKRQFMQFQKGQSGNPAGRPRGARSKATIRMQMMLERRAKALVNKTVDIALAGNVAALRLCLDRLVPTRKTEPVICDMAPLEKTSDAVAAIAGIASAAAAGDVTADEAAKLAKVIALYVNSLEAHDFEERLARLERVDLNRRGAMSKDTSQSNGDERADT